MIIGFLAATALQTPPQMQVVAAYQSECSFYISDRLSRDIPCRAERQAGVNGSGLEFIRFVSADGTEDITFYGVRADQYPNEERIEVNLVTTEERAAPYTGVCNMSVYRWTCHFVLPDRILFNVTVDLEGVRPLPR